MIAMGLRNWDKKQQSLDQAQKDLRTVFDGRKSFSIKGMGKGLRNWNKKQQYPRSA